MQWAVLGLTIFFILFSWMIIQGTRAALAYRGAAARGDLDVIRQILEDAISVWRSQRRPKEVPEPVWRGVQSMQLVDYGPDIGRVSVAAESEYKLVEGVWREISNPLQEGFSISAKALDMLLYELPNLKLERVQVDVYTTFRDEGGQAVRRCILCTLASREGARKVDWDVWSAVDIVDAFGGRYRLGEFGQALSIEPLTTEAGVPPEERRREPAA